MNAATTLRTRTQRPSVLRRAIVTALGAGLVVTGLVAGASVALAGPRDGFETRSANVRIVDGRGNLVDDSTHVLDVAGAYPGMPAQHSELRLRNSGSVPAAFDVEATDLRTTGHGNLDRVLVITVFDGATGDLLYRGPLSGLEVSGSASVRPGSSATYPVEVTWPDRGGDEKRYQGSTIAFTVTATAHELAA